jgi:thiol peroxidase
MAENNAKVTFKGNPMTMVGNEIKVGQQAPEFTAVGATLNHVKLSDYAGKVVVLSVYPSIDTGVCATQNRTFNKLAADLGENIVIVGLSKDLPFAQSRFCGAEGIDKVVSLSDYRDMGFVENYGFLMDELGLLARGIVVIGKDGVVEHVEYVAEGTTEPDYSAALEVAKGLV